MVRSLERRPLFHDDGDRADFLRRLAEVSEATGLQVLAWALMPNHVHLLVRTADGPLASAMRRLLTGYAGAFNRRHRRHGHVFQNRYKSIVVEADPYLLELTRYIHLNPLRAGVVPELRALDRYPWTGHSAIIGRRSRPWQAVADVMGHFGGGRGGRERYRAFMAAGTAQGRRADLQGGGLRRSLGGWEGVAALRRGREAWTSDERVLGSSAFVQRLLAELPRPLRPGPGKLDALLARIAAAWRLTRAELTGGGRRHPLVAARYAASCLGVRHLGLPAATMARTLNVSLQAVLRGVDEGPRILADRGLDAAKVVKRL